MRVSLALFDRKTGVEQENALSRPPSEVAVSRTGESGNVSLKFLEHVSQARRRSNPRLDGETETVGLAWTMIRILTKDDDLAELPLDTFILKVYL